MHAKVRVSTTNESTVVLHYPSNLILVISSRCVSWILYIQQFKKSIDIQPRVICNAYILAKDQLNFAKYATSFHHPLCSDALFTTYVV